MQFELLRRSATDKKQRERELEAVRREPLVIQRRLRVGASNDPLEHEADAMAHHVMRRLSATADGSHQEDLPFGSAPATTRVRRKTGGGSAADGFTASPDVESRIQAARSSGAALDPATMSRFGAAMGADLSGVRVHHNENADQLNRSLSAKAFTTGQDVFFSSGSYDPKSKPGQELLAHELAHTVQQSGSARRTTIRRMTVEDADFSKTTTVKVFSGGASGNVAEFSDGSGSIIVKVDQLIGNEVAVADKLHSQMGKKHGKSKGYSVGGPNSRVASSSERKAIKAATLAKIGDGDPRNFVAGLDSDNPVIIAEKVSGAKFSDLMEKDQVTRADGNGGLEADPQSKAFKLLTESGAITALAKAAPADIAMGMGDRFLSMWNAENFLYDEASKTFKFVDNTQNHGAGFLTSAMMADGNIASNLSAFTEWCGVSYVTKLQGKDFGGIADQMVKMLMHGFISRGKVGVKRSPEERKADGKIERGFKAAFEPHQPKMKASVMKGLKAGHATLLGQLKKPLPLAAGVPADKRLEAVQSLLARYYFLKGATVEGAWQRATAEATQLVPAAKTPTRPTTAAPELPQKPAAVTPFAAAQARGQGNRAAGGGHRMPKLPVLPGR